MSSKRCTKCDEVKPLEMFPLRKNSPDGRRNKCRDCNNQQIQEHRSQPRVRERVRERNRQFYRRHADEIHEKEKGKHKNLRLHARSAWLQRNPGAKDAGWAVRNAIKRGDLPKASACFCTECGEPAREYHHYLGYAREHWLDVIPLCRTCHRLTFNL